MPRLIVAVSLLVVCLLVGCGIAAVAVLASRLAPWASVLVIVAAMWAGVRSVLVIVKEQIRRG